MPHVRIENLSFSYDRDYPIFVDLNAFFGTDSDSRRGHIVGVAGDSGAGKSTLLNLIAGLETQSQGKIDVAPGEGVGYLPQVPVLFDHLSPDENGRLLSRLRSFRESFDDNWYRELCVRLNLKSVMKRRSIQKLSGGEQQRLALLRALSVKPSILLLDEPCTGLDQYVKQEFLHILRRLADEFEMLCIYVSHHPDETKILADSVLFLRRSQEGCSFSHSNLATLIERPPTIESARFFGAPTFNCLKVRLQSHIIYSLAGNAPLFLVENSELPDGEYFYTFSPESVAWDVNSAIEVDPVGKSALYWLCLVRGATGGLIVGPATSRPPYNISITGPGHLFFLNGNLALTVTATRQATSNLAQ